MRKLADDVDHVRAAMFSRQTLIEQTDPELWAVIQAENARQEAHIELIADVLDDPRNPATVERVRAQVAELTARFPVYG